MRRTPTSLLLFMLLLLVVLVVLALPDDKKPAEEPGQPPTPEQAAADAVLAAVKAQDGAALKALATQDEPDPWVVVELLLAQGQRAPAVAFAQAAPRPATAALARYAETHRDALRGQRLDAVRALNEALGSGEWERALGDLDPENAPALTDPAAGISGIRLVFGRGLALRELGRLAESETAFREAGEAALELGWFSRAALGFHRAGRQAYAAGDPERAQGLWVRTHRAARQGEDRSMEALAQSNIGVALLDLGRYAEARVAIEEALSIRRRIGPPHDLAENLVNAAAAYQRMGAYGAALSALEEAHALAQQVRDRALQATVLRGLGAMKILVREPHDALEYFEAALAISTALGQDADAMARDLEAVGDGLSVVRRFEEAVEHFQRALVIRRQRGDGRSEGRVLTHLGAVYSRMDRQQEAAATFAEALGIQQRLGDARGAAATLLRLGTLHGEAQDYDKARTALQSAQTILDDLPDPDLQMRVHWAFAGVHYGLREWRACVDRCHQAERIASSLAAGLGEQEAGGAADNWVGIFDTALRAAVRLPAKERSAELWYFLESGRAYALREAIQARGALQEALIPEALRRESVQARDNYARAVAALRAARAKRRLKDVRRARQRVHAARARQASLLARIQRTAKAGAAIAYPRPDDLREAQSRLAPDEALVAYGLTERDGIALVLTRDAVTPVTLAASAGIVAACEALLANDEYTIEPEAVAPLRALLVTPLKLPANVRRVLISPTGILGYVPFCLLLPERAVAFVPSGTTHGLLLADHDARGDGVLGLGDPTYGKPRRGGTRALLRGSLGGRLPPLPATRAEVDSIADVLLLGADATEATLRKAIATRARWRAVHLACHGLVDAERPLFSALALTPDGKDDGLLTCVDLFGLRVPADLVTLSACETAKGRIYRTEGILGLTRAFMFAGAPRVLCSLWRVDDEATRALMVKFYELWNPKQGQGLGAALALKKAQAFVRGHDKWKHPYYWAAWVLWGLPD